MAESLDAQYQFLLQLKEIDERAFLVERDVGLIPGELAKHDAALATRRSAFDSAKAQVADCEKRLRAAERELKEKEDALFKAEGKMMEVKTNEEYQAAMRENAVQKAAKATLEDNVLKLITDLEGEKGKLGDIEKVFKTEEGKILAEKTKLQQENAELQKLLETLTEKRKNVSGQMEPSAASLYQKILALRRGTAVATTDNGRCLSCNLQVRPQIYNEILGHKAIHRCGNCG
ncbi:hypothetical protein K2X33_07015, partial [bacterium]|nr:hypothetical protein [bacterium]